MQLEARVVPNAKRFSVSLRGNAIKVRIPERAEDGRANLGLVKRLGDALGMKVTIVRGHKARDKTLHIEGGESEILSRLQAISEKGENDG